MTIRTIPFDAAATLNSEGRIAAYINAALETNDAAFIAEALGTVAKARGMTQVAKDAGVSRVSLYRTLSAEGNPELTTVLRVMQAMGLQLQAAPAHSIGTGKHGGAGKATRRATRSPSRKSAHARRARG